MSFWINFKNGVKPAGRTVEGIINELGNALGMLFELPGAAIDTGCNWLGSKMGLKPVFAWLGGVIKAAFSLIASVVKGPIGVIAGVAGGVTKILGGILTVQGMVILEGLWDFFSPAIGTLVVVLGKLIGLIQTIFFLQAFERPLTGEEQDHLRKIYGRSLNCYVVRIIDGRSGIFGVSSRPFTMGNSIYMKYSWYGIDLVVHETMHAWQYQDLNNRYAADAIFSQWFVKDAYNWRKEIEDRDKQDWRDFNKEGQAEFFQDLWRTGQLKDALGNILESGNGAFFKANGVDSFGFFFDFWSGGDFTTIARKALSIVQRG